MAANQSSSSGYESFQIEDGANEKLLNDSSQKMIISSENSKTSFLSGIIDKIRGQTLDPTPVNILHTRKVPVKVEPKVFFANERTFLAWLHMAMTLASISVGIVAFSGDSLSAKRYGLILMPVAISFCVYALYIYIKVHYIKIFIKIYI